MTNFNYHACIRQTTLTQSRAPDRVIGWTNFSHEHSVHGLRQNVPYFNLSAIYLFVLVGVELPLCIAVTLSQNATTCFLESS